MEEHSLSRVMASLQAVRNRGIQWYSRTSRATDSETMHDILRIMMKTAVEVLQSHWSQTTCSCGREAAVPGARAVRSSRPDNQTRLKKPARETSEASQEDLRSQRETSEASRETKRKRSSVKDLHKAQWLVFKDLGEQLVSDARSPSTRKPSVRRMHTQTLWRQLVLPPRTKLFTEYQETFPETDADAVEAAGAPTEDGVKRQCTSSGFHSSMKLSGAQRDFEHYLARNLDDFSTEYVIAPNRTYSRHARGYHVVNGTRVVGNLLSNDLSFYVEANKFREMVDAADRTTIRLEPEIISVLRQKAESIVKSISPFRCTAGHRINIPNDMWLEIKRSVLAGRIDRNLFCDAQRT
ncbi:hypothetical protein CRUP_029921, partial [Coryphaenoides rupestris]